LFLHNLQNLGNLCVPVFSVINQGTLFMTYDKLYLKHLSAYSKTKKNVKLLR